MARTPHLAQPTVPVDAPVGVTIAFLDEQLAAARALPAA